MNRGTDTHDRDRGLRLIRRTTLGGVGGALGLTGLLSTAAALTFSGQRAPVSEQQPQAPAVPVESVPVQSVPPPPIVVEHIVHLPAPPPQVIVARPVPGPSTQLNAPRPPRQAPSPARTAPAPPPLAPAAAPPPSAASPPPPPPPPPPPKCMHSTPSRPC
jgi:hypothetical protein